MTITRTPSSGQTARAREIAGTLARHGLGYLVGTLGLETVVPFHRGLLGHPRRAEPYTRPEHVRMALEDLGPVFVKLGQIASTHPGLLPPDHQRELARLHDAVPPVSTAAIREVIESDIGSPIEELFSSFTDEPIAAASIGQAHVARLHDGTEVIVKVQRPGVAAQVESDLALIRRLAETASHRWDVAERYDVVGLAEEFSETLRAELDYRREAANVARIAASFAADPEVRIPRVYPQASGDRVLTLGRLRGIMIDDLAALDAQGVDRAALAARAARTLMKMVFEDGFFHADPHPGNFFIGPDGRIGLIDFGMTGAIDDPTREQLVDILLALRAGDTSRLVDAFLGLGVARSRIDRAVLERDLARVVVPYCQKALGEISIAAALGDMLEVIRRHHLVLPRDLALLVKTLIMSEGLATRLAPEFKLMSVLAPYAQRMLARRFAPDVFGPRLARAANDVVGLGLTLPRRVDRLLGTLEHGGIEVSVRVADVEPLVDRFDRSTHRLVMGIIVAALINGAAVLVSAFRPAGWDGWTSFAMLLGFAIAAAVATHFAAPVLRKR